MAEFRFVDGRWVRRVEKTWKGASIAFLGGLWMLMVECDGCGDNDV